MLYIYIFLMMIIICSFFVILSRNPVQSVLFLMLVYVLAAMVFFWVGAEFIAFTVLIVYVGAISILFLFVVMMLDLRIVELYSTFFNYLPIGSFIGILFFFEIFYWLSNDFSLYNLDSGNDFTINFIDKLFPKSNLLLFGELLYNYFNFFVILMGLILLIAMLGSILLTMDFNEKFLKNPESFYQTVKFKSSKISFWGVKSRGKKYVK